MPLQSNLKTISIVVDSIKPLEWDEPSSTTCAVAFDVHFVSLNLGVFSVKGDWCGDRRI